MKSLIQCKPTILPRFIGLALACFALSQGAQGVVPPPPGGYPNFTTAAGEHALQALTLGLGNTAIGTFSLFSVTTGNFNTAVGAGALDLNTADSNTATGAAALLFNTTGTENTANGTSALEFNTTGSNNTASGAFALLSNTVGGANTAFGDQALLSNTTAFENTAVGAGALGSNTTGNGNTAIGFTALVGNIVGVANTAEGFQTLAHSTGNGNTAVGHAALTNTTGNGNTAIGFNAGSALTTGDNNIDIGGDVIGVAGEANTIRIGDPNIATTFIRGISGATVPAGATVFVSANGQLGTLTSSERFKDEIKPMDQASEALFALKPVTFRYKREIDPTGTSQFGLVAEAVEKVNPDLVVRDEKGKPYTVRYEQVDAMLLNEFLKEHRKVEQMQKQIEALTAGLQQVSAQLELSKAAPQTVQNSQ
jgi:endosialidase-like protein